ncbi:MAG TPA: CHAD domain-containing protein [Candidatus Acidoferrum sp.]|jgi:CHAD domain-containing protein
MTILITLPEVGNAERLPLPPRRKKQRREHRNLAYWMGRTLKELDKLREASKKDTVHDLRVALRRCRSVATVIAEVDSAPEWRELKVTSKKLFKRLGALRDAQVLQEWVGKLDSGEANGLRESLEAALEKKEFSLTKETSEAAAKFDRKEWEHLSEALAKRARLIVPGSLTAQCLAFERFAEAKDLHARALRSAKPAAWHELRIGLKRLRYTTENLMPDFYATHSNNLKRLQDLLGDIHDLDVLAETIEEMALPGTADACAAWQDKIAKQRDERVQTYRQLMLGKTSLLNEWAHDLPKGDGLVSAAAARLRTTTRASGTHLQRAKKISSIALGLFDACRRVHATTDFKDGSLRRILGSAAKLERLRVEHKGESKQKAAYQFLQNLPVPPTWTVDEWEILAGVVRYHRGGEPKERRGAFAKLSQEQQRIVRALAGLLRLAAALRNCGIETGTGFRAEMSESALTLSIPELIDSVDTAVRLAAGKHLLEGYLDKPIVLKPAASREETIHLPEAAAPKPVLVFAAASD